MAASPRCFQLARDGARVVAGESANDTHGQGNRKLLELRNSPFPIANAEHSLDQEEGTAGGEAD